MSPEERVAAYDEAVQVLNNYAAQEAAKIGNSQASLGLMAERVARPSGATSGLANYTYNRTLRPTVDTLAANLTTSGRSQALEKQLYDALTAAKNRYEDAKNRYTVSSSAATNNNNNAGGTGLTNNIVGNTTDSGATQKPYPPAGTITGIGSENGVYRIIVADGKGGFNQYQYSAGSQDEALRKFYAGEGRVYIPDSGSNGGGIAGGGGGGGGGRVR